MESARFLGQYERMFPGHIIYRGDQEYLVFNSKEMKVTRTFPLKINIYQSLSALIIWLVATGGF